MCSIEIKRSPITLKPNYILIPVTRTDNSDFFNSVLNEYKNRNYNRLQRTPSGGISSKHFRGLGIDLRTNKWGAELIVIDMEGCFRLQFRNKILDDDNIDEVQKKITGKQSLTKFYKELKTINIDLNSYAITNGKEIKATIEKPLIKLERESYKDMTFDNVHHIDMNSSYPAGVKEYRPEFAPIIDKWYNAKQQGNKEYKAYLNLMIGTMQSKYVNYKFSDISAYAIKRNNDKLKEMAQWLKDNDRIVIAYNTDGIWFKGDQVPFNSKELGEFKQDHTNCIIRFKSAGAYEFIENGVYTPVIRGKTRLDDIKPRTEWAWGDIYSENANLIKKYSVSWEEGVKEVYEKE